MMQSSNGPLEAMRALGSISSGSGGGSGMVPAAMHLAQRGGLGDAYPAALMQQQYLQSLPWLLRMQARAPSLAGQCALASLDLACLLVDSGANALGLP